MNQPRRTVLYDHHIHLGAHMVDFGGWSMPMQYSSGIVREHLNTRKQAGLFDVSHMGRFLVRGRSAVEFLQHVLTNDAAALKAGESQYTIIANEHGGAIDDAYLYHFNKNEFLLVVNAANRITDWEYFQTHLKRFELVELIDQTEPLAMISLQGPLSQEIVVPLLSSGNLPQPARNSLSIAVIKGIEVWIARTGYTGEPLCFELFTLSEHAGMLWDVFIERGAQPVGLGARDTLRLEAGLPLYGHELGVDPEGREIPVFAMSSSRFAVSFSPSKGDFVGKQSLQRQFEALHHILKKESVRTADLPRRIVSIALTGKGIARNGNSVFQGDKRIGYVTSGTMVPYWKFQKEATTVRLTDEIGKRAIALALVDSGLGNGDELEIDIRGKRTKALIVSSHLKKRTSQYAYALLP